MGGRGARSASGGIPVGGVANQPSPNPSSTLKLSADQLKNDYTDGGNAGLVKWQGQTDDKSANFLARVDNTTNLAQIQSATGDKWAFYDNPQQKLVGTLGLNKPATVLSDSDFNKYVKQTGATVLYRGWSGTDAVDRFKNSPNSHIGNGINGDGYYFAPDRSTARSYGGVGMRAALSPNARVVSIHAVNAQIANSSPKLQRSLMKAGSNGTRTFGSNKGQAQMALKMGYNVIDAGWAVIPLTRDAVVVSSQRAW